MATDREIERLKRRLQWEGAGPLTDLSNQALETLVARLRVLVQWVRELGGERPFILCLLAFEVGFAAGRWGGRRAQHKTS
jgi:hypothetical protein